MVKASSTILTAHPWVSWSLGFHLCMVLKRGDGGEDISTFGVVLHNKLHALIWSVDVIKSHFLPVTKRVTVVQTPSIPKSSCTGAATCPWRRKELGHIQDGLALIKHVPRCLTCPPHRAPSASVYHSGSASAVRFVKHGWVMCMTMSPSQSFF